MIPKGYITQWRQSAPWVEDVQVEQDLIIRRGLVELFNKPRIHQSLAFRGGTALHKLYMEPARYSEDIDLVQIHQEPIGETIDAVRDALSPWLGESKKWEKKRARFTLHYEVSSEPQAAPPIQLKIEINTREHFAVMGFKTLDFSVSSRWFEGETDLRTFSLEELLGTKLRALYQRSQGRDLFDLWYALKTTDAVPKEVVDICREYLDRKDESVTRAQFEQNLDEKASDAGFRTDVNALLASHVEWDFDTAFEQVLDHYIAKFPGDPWKG